MRGKREGFTIPELSLSIAIMIVIFAVFMSFFMMVVSSVRKSSFLIDTSRGLDMTLESISLDLAKHIGSAFQMGIGAYTSDFVVYTNRADANALWEKSVSNLPPWADGVFDTDRSDVLCVKHVVPNTDNDTSLIRHVCWGLRRVGNAESVLRLEHVERSGTPVFLDCYGEAEDENCLITIANFSLIPQPLWNDIELRFKIIPLRKTLGHILEVSGGTGPMDLTSIESYTGLVVTVTFGLPHFDKLNDLSSGDYIRRSMRLRCADATCDVSQGQKELIESYLRRSLSLRFIGSY